MVEDVAMQDRGSLVEALTEVEGQGNIPVARRP